MCIYVAVNVALRKPARQISTYLTEAGAAVDGKVTTGEASCTSNTTNAWWAVDLGQEYDISRVIITSPYSERYGNYRRQGRNSGSVLGVRIPPKFQGEIDTHTKTDLLFSPLSMPMFIFFIFLMFDLGANQSQELLHLGPSHLGLGASSLCTSSHNTLGSPHVTVLIIADLTSLRIYKLIDKSHSHTHRPSICDFNNQKIQL